MKKLILSAYVVSLIILSQLTHAQTEGIDDFLGLESEVLPELKGGQRFTSPDLHQKESWNVLEKNVEQDQQAPNYGQGHSIIPWGTQTPEDFLSIHTWMTERALKDQTPDWKIRLRHSEHKELMGKVLQCRGVCDVYRGSSKASVQHLSQIKEGDELKTEANSVAWVYLMDGSLIRVSPSSSISFHEFNIGQSEIFILARLNRGHIFWHARNKKEVLPEFSPETDSVSLPLMIREANQGYFERLRFAAQTDREHLTETIDLDEHAIKDQTAMINSLKTENSGLLSLKTKTMVITPNSTLVAQNVSFDYVYVPGGKAYFKKRQTEENEEFQLHLRGYETGVVNTITDNLWNEVEVMGRGFSLLENVPGTLQVLELITKRIKTIELAREIWIKNFTLPLLKVKDNPSQLARDFGHTIWGEALQKRFDFLVEYTRRVETSNLRSMENLLARLEKGGEKVNRELSDEQVQVSLNHYLLGLKTRYDKKKMRVREMSDLHYYVWILKNGKF